MTVRWLDKRYQRAGKAWTEYELDYLVAKYGLIKDLTICRHLQRSPTAIRIVALRKLRCNHKMNFYSATELAKALGVRCSKTLIPWVEANWLKARRSVLRAGEYRTWLFTEKNVVKFLRKMPWLFDPKKMPEHYFRSIVRAEYEKDPWYDCKEAATLLGLTTDDVVRRYIDRGWLSAVKKPGGPWQGKWIIRRSDIEKFLANDPRPRHNFEAYSSSRKMWARHKGSPVRLSVVWSVLCPDCGQTVVVKADPSLRGPQVQQLFIRLYTNVTCSHGLVCELAYRRYQVDEIIGKVNPPSPAELTVRHYGESGGDNESSSVGGVSTDTPNHTRKPQ